jgi:hypothetical protein
VLCDTAKNLRNDFELKCKRLYVKNQDYLVLVISIGYPYIK